MTKTELLELIRNGETSGVEFKRDTIDNRALAKELVAFANFQGGQVLLGVEDDGAIVGTTRPNLEEWVMTACRDKIRPECQFSGPWVQFLASFSGSWGHPIFRKMGPPVRGA
jgi:ATP-dependent DNA helicase RecG